MSVIGKEEGIRHGTTGGYKQHRRRQVPACEECLEAVREDARRRTAERRQAATEAKVSERSRAQAQWYGGKHGVPTVPTQVTVPGDCTVDGCGHPANARPPTIGLVRVHLAGSRQSATWYCPAHSGYGRALAEIRALRPKADAA
jgi:hypothetical protein